MVCLQCLKCKVSLITLIRQFSFPRKEIVTLNDDQSCDHPIYVFSRITSKTRLESMSSSSSEAFFQRRKFLAFVASASWKDSSFSFFKFHPKNSTHRWSVNQMIFLYFWRIFTIKQNCWLKNILVISVSLNFTLIFIFAKVISSFMLMQGNIICIKYGVFLLTLIVLYCWCVCEGFDIIV